MTEYLLGVIPWIRGRAEMLHDRLDPAIRHESLHVVLEELRALLGSIVAEANETLENQTLSNPSYADNHLTSYRSWVRTVNDIETDFLPICELWGADEESMQMLLNDVTAEVALPEDVRRPVIALYGASYEVETNMGIIFAPRMERHFLLHLPDLYHELAHLIDYAYWDVLSLDLTNAVVNHFDPLIRKGKANDDPFYMDGTYQRSQNYWFNKWRAEFTCDVVATLLCGPAYAWAHLHLCASNSDDDVYHGSETHPADHARFLLISHVLERMEELEQMRRFGAKWESFLATLNQTRPASFDFAFPTPLIEYLAATVHDGLVSLGMNVYDGTAPTAALLNDAWAAFWDNPAGYREWEEVASNGRLLGGTTRDG